MNPGSYSSHPLPLSPTLPHSLCLKIYISPFFFFFSFRIKGYYSHIDTLNVDFMLSNLYWRNTEESVKGEDQIPPIVKDLVLLDFTGSSFPPPPPIPIPHPPSPLPLPLSLLLTCSSSPTALFSFDIFFGFRYREDCLPICTRESYALYLHLLFVPFPSPPVLSPLLPFPLSPPLSPSLLFS